MQEKLNFSVMLLGYTLSTAPWWSQVGGEGINWVFPARRHWDPLKSLSGNSKCVGKSPDKEKLRGQHWAGLWLLTCAEVWY